MGLAALRQAKADDYVRVEYIENTSNAYIDTKLFTVYNDGRTYKHIVNLSYTVTNKRQLNGADGDGFFGINTNGNFECAYIKDSAIRVGDSWHNINFSYYKSTNTSLNIKYEIDNQLLEKNISNTTLYKYPFAIYIFAIGSINVESPSFFCKERIKSYQIYIDDELVRDFIPMYQISTDTYGLWDRVTEEFYTSPNGVKFTGGERVIADADDNLYYLKDYIKCNGTTNTFINLSKFTNLDNVEFEVYSNTAHDNFIGSRSGTPLKNHFQIAKWSNTRIDISFGQSPTSITSKNTGNKKFKIKLWERIIYLDNKKFYTCPNNTFTTNTVVSLGAVKGSSQPTSARFYWFKWWNKDKDLIYDMIPVQRISDGVWGMFCKVHLGFYPSNGSAQFTGG